MKYPLEEKIGHPDLFVGREKEFRNVRQWIDNIPRKLSKSRVILARRKSGKTAFVQRVFNQLWHEQGQVIPFYFNVGESKVWYRNFALRYYQTFASHYISFRERDESLVMNPLSLDKIREYGVTHAIQLLVDDVDLFLAEMERNPDVIWETAYSAPHRFAARYGVRVLVIIDEFQYLTKYIYRDEKCQGEPDEAMPGSFHFHVESKVAPMLVTGSYISWIVDISGKYLEAGRLSYWRMSPSLPPDEGLQAVYKYSELYHQPITNETAVLLNQLCFSDPFFISCVVQSYYEEKDLTTIEGVINTVNYEITDYESEMVGTWTEYIRMTLPKINDIHSKQILLHLSKYNDRDWTPKEIQAALSLEIPIEKIHKKLELMVDSDLIDRGKSDIDYRGLRDGTLYLILRHRFEKEITSFTPDLRGGFRQEVEALRRDKQRLQGMLNNLSGKMAEYQLAVKFRSEKRLALSDYFSGVKDTARLNLVNVQTRVVLQRVDGKMMELDVVAESSDGRVVLVGVKKWQTPIGVTVVVDFQEKVAVYAAHHPDNMILPAMLSLGGFTAEARDLCVAQGIGMMEQLFPPE